MQTAKMQTYQDAIEAMLSQSIILPPDLLKEVEDFIEENKQLGFTTRDEFMRDAARWRLKSFTEDYEYIETQRIRLVCSHPHHNLGTESEDQGRVEEISS